MTKYLSARGSAFVWIGLTTVLGLGCNGSDSGATASSGGSAAGGAKVSLLGAGSSFVNPVMSKWTYGYHADHANVDINYQSVGSSAGISQFQTGTIDFGATDAPVSDEELAKMPTPSVQFPVVAGCVVLAYNLPGISSGLKLSGEAIADIYLGKIKTWNDPALSALNPNLKLPSTAITVAHRSEGSGTTFMFTDYLAKVSPAWKAGPGTGKIVTWPVGVGGKGSDGVAGLVKQTPGCIGYVELAYATQAKLTYGPIRNKSGAFIEASAQSTTAAVDSWADALKTDIRSSIVDAPGKDAYPIVGMTYLLLSKAPKDASKGAALVEFMKWAVGPGQKVSAELQYAPLPQSVVDLDNAVLASAVSGAKN